MGKIVGHASRIDKVREIIIARAGTSIRTAADGLDQAAQDGEFELQLDAVHGGLQRDLDNVPIEIFDDDEHNVHDDGGGVGGDEFVLDLGASVIVVWRVNMEEADGFANVQGGQEAFLHAEPGELESFHDVEAQVDGAHVHVNGGKGEDGNGNDQDEGGDADEPQNSAEEFNVLQDEVQT